MVTNLTDSIKDKLKIVSEPDQGIYEALNKGIKFASGDVISFLHSDDFYADECVLKNVADKFEESKSDSVYGDLQYVRKNNIGKIVRHWESGDFDLRKLKNGWMPPHPSFFVKKKVYKKHGDFDLSFKIAADYDFMMRVLFKGQISASYLPEVCVKMRVGGESNRSIRNVIRKTKEDFRAIKNNDLGGLSTLLCKHMRKIPQFISQNKQKHEGL